MELFDENIEQLILQKEYFELSKEEKDGIAEFISNEEEYAQFKMTLLMSSDLQTENIQPKKETKASLLQILENSKPESKVWYNSLFLFFFPENRPSYAKPGIYLALGVIVIGVFLTIPLGTGKVQMEEKDMANSDDNKYSEESVAEKSEAPKEIGYSNDSDKKLEQVNSVLSEELEESVELSTNDDVSNNQNELAGGAFADEMSPTLMDAEDKADGEEKSKKKSEKDITIDYTAGVYSKSNKGGVSESEDESIGTGEVANGSTITTTASNREAKHSSKTKGYISGDLSKESFRVEVLNDNALSQNKNLIDILYTAD